MTIEEYLKSLFKKQYAMEHRFMGKQASSASRNSTLGDSIGVRDSNSDEVRSKLKKRGAVNMKLKDFYVLVSKLEGKKSETSIGNIREVTKVINGILSKKLGTKDFLYKIIRRM